EHLSVARPRYESGNASGSPSLPREFAVVHRQTARWFPTTSDPIRNARLWSHARPHPAERRELPPPESGIRLRHPGGDTRARNCSAPNTPPDRQTILCPWSLLLPTIWITGENVVIACAHKFEDRHCV